MELSSPLSSLFLQNVTASGVCLPLLLLLFMVYYYFGSRDPNRHRYPPGPGYALPLIGHLYQLGSSPQVTFLKWKQKYGHLIFYKMGSQNAVIVNNAKLAKELFSNVASAGRPNSPLYDILSNSGHGFMFSSGEGAAAHRSFAIKTLSELGLSKSGRLEGLILDEVEHFMRYFEQRVGGGVSFRATRLFNAGVVSTLWGIVSGEKVEGMDENGVLVEHEICKHAGQLMTAMNKTLSVGLAAIPGLRHLPFFRPIWKAFEVAVNNFHGMVEDKIQAHSETLDTLSPRDFIDHGVVKIGSTTDPSSSFYKERGRQNLTTSVQDLFFAGSETTPTALEYLLMYLGTHPEIQGRLAHELSHVLGGRVPTLSDRKMLPYAEAVLMETLRRSSTVSMSPHEMVQDLEFQGYLLPKHTFVMLDVYSILRDPDTWGDADAFRPERFLNEDGSKVVVPEEYMPFGPGRRNCIGESLAVDTLFLFLTSIFQKFRVEVVPDGTFDLDDVKPGVTLEHEPFDIRVYRRNV